VAVAFVRTVKTASSATAVQIVYSNRRGSRDIEHIGSAHTPQEVEALKAVARQRLHANQDSLDFGDGQPEGEALPITSTRSKHLWEALCLAYSGIGFDTACGADEVFQALVLARVIEPVSKLDTIRVLDEIGSCRPAIAPSCGGCPVTPAMSGGSGSRRRARRTWGWGRPPW
jgi:hypothetical protein